MSNEELSNVIDRAEDEYQKLKDKVIEQQEEIERLNNIINIANKKLKNISKSSSAYNYQCKIEEVINILQELKGSDKE